jgi:hypothetical protein
MFCQKNYTTRLANFRFSFLQEKARLKLLGANFREVSLVY